MDLFISIVITILTFGVLILVHEFGHYIVAKKCGIAINEFSIGMGPTIYRKKGKETDFLIKALPIGGYVALEGEDEESTTDNPKSFASKTKLQRVAVLVAGAVMNILFGIIVVFIINCFSNGFVSNTIKTVEFTEQSMLQPGDKIVSLDGYATHNYADLSFAVSNIETTDFSATIIRNGEKIEIDNIPLVENEGSYKLGITLVREEKNLGTILKYTAIDTISTIRLVWQSLVFLVTGRVGIAELSGPVGITALVKDYVKYGPLTILNIISIIALNLGVMNLLPFPALDGGRILFIGIEAIIRRPIPEKVAGIVNLVGFSLLMLLTAFVFVNDIIKVF